jgi:hypothetical protein
VDLPIGVHSLNELGHRIRIEEMTLNKIVEELAKGTDQNQIEAWTKVKEIRDKWLQHLEDERVQWAIVGSYLSIKVKSDRARSMGTFRRHPQRGSRDHRLRWTSSPESPSRCSCLCRTTGSLHSISHADGARPNLRRVHRSANRD